MSFPTLRELELELEVSRLKAELDKAKNSQVTINRSFLNQDLPVHDNGRYSLMPSIEVRGSAPFHPTDNFIVHWKNHNEDGYHEIMYKADFITLTPYAAEHALESMLRRCLYHIIDSRRQKV